MANSGLCPYRVTVALNCDISNEVGMFKVRIYQTLDYK